MKKVICFILCAVLLLSFAGCGEKAPDPEVTPTTTIAETTTTTERVTSRTSLEEAQQRDRERRNESANKFAEILREGDAVKLGGYMRSEELAKLLTDTVEIAECVLIPTETDAPPRLRLQVTKSGYAPIPVGTSEWWICADYDVYLCPADEDYKARWGGWHTFNQHGAVRFSAAAAEDLELFETVEDFSKLPAEWYVQEAGMIARLHNTMEKVRYNDPTLEEHLTTEQVSVYIKNTFDVDVTDFTASDCYIAPEEDADIPMVRLKFLGGQWNFYSVVDHTQKGDVHTVTLRFYADAFHLTEAVTMRYTVKELPSGEYRMLSCEQLSNTGYPPAQGNH